MLATAKTRFFRPEWGVSACEPSRGSTFAEGEQTSTCEPGVHESLASPDGRNANTATGAKVRASASDVILAGTQATALKPADAEYKGDKILRMCELGAHRSRAGLGGTNACTAASAKACAAAPRASEAAAIGSDVGVAGDGRIASDKQQSATTNCALRPPPCWVAETRDEG